MDYSNNNQQFLQGHYLSIRGVTVELSSEYKCPELISLPYEYIITNDRIIIDNDYNFSKEINYLKELDENKKIEEQKKIEKLKSKAPGLSDKVLEPIKINQNEQNEKRSESESNKDTTTQSNICISDFEDVPPLDPWDRSKTNKDELLQLQLEMSEMLCSDPNEENSNNNPKINESSQICTSPLQLATTSPSLQNSNIQLQQNQPNNSQQQQPGYNVHPYTTSSQNLTSYPYQMPPQYDNPTSGYQMPPQYENITNGYQNHHQYDNLTSGYQIPPPLPDRPTAYQQSIQSNPTNDLLESIVNMGFRRSIVTRGMSSYGNNKQKIIDYSINFTYFENKGYLPKHIDTAISLYDLNRGKCEQFLESFVKLIEMGFDQEEIKEALVFSENDSEAAIDHLTKNDI